MIPANARRVALHTAPHLNQRIRQDLERRLAAYQGANMPELIGIRLRELDEEWDVERVLQTNFALFSLLGLLLADRVDKRWLLLAAAVPAFMVQHALQGWCPPLPLMRRLGFRTAQEIAEERYALQAMRGDFEMSRGPADLVAATAPDNVQALSTHAR